mmetsp:Transcript_69554/g.141423  ORF Transcript_69554/g.141423 Transcript_69554/m.141423 type:complete len:99 (-) Transcript_69554:516-812(-)
MHLSWHAFALGSTVIFMPSMSRGSYVIFSSKQYDVDNDVVVDIVDVVIVDVVIVDVVIVAVDAIDVEVIDVKIVSTDAIDVDAIVTVVDVAVIWREFV